MIVAKLAIITKFAKSIMEKIVFFVGTANVVMSLAKNVIRL